MADFKGWEFHSTASHRCDVARLAGGYVELIRNLPLLFQILFWYLAVLSTLPSPRQSFSFFGLAFVNNRGLVVPERGLPNGRVTRRAWAG